VTEAAWSNLVVFEARPGREKPLEECLTHFTLQCREEEGCLQYDCFQSFENPARFLLQILWRDAGSLENHLESEAVVQFLVRVSIECLNDELQMAYRNFAPASQKS